YVEASVPLKPLAGLYVMKSSLESFGVAPRLTVAVPLLGTPVMRRVRKPPAGLETLAMTGMLTGMFSVVGSDAAPATGAGGSAGGAPTVRSLTPARPTGLPSAVRVSTVTRTP